MHKEILKKAKDIKCLICDVDGVLSNGQVIFSHEGHHAQSFHVHDGFGLTVLPKIGIEIGIISASKSPVVKKRIEFLNIQHVYQGYYNKMKAYEHLKAKLSLNDHQIAYIGDDLPDIALIKQAGLGITVPNAVIQVREIADYQTTQAGGHGAVREICDLLIHAQDKYSNIIDWLNEHEHQP